MSAEDTLGPNHREAQVDATVHPTALDGGRGDAGMLLQARNVGGGELGIVELARLTAESCLQKCLEIVGTFDSNGWTAINPREKAFERPEPAPISAIYNWLKLARCVPEGTDGRGSWSSAL